MHARQDSCSVLDANWRLCWPRNGVTNVPEAPVRNLEVVASLLREHPQVEDALVIQRADLHPSGLTVAYVVPIEVGTSALTEKQVIDEWAALWDATYRRNMSPKERHLNTAGWFSNYTNTPVSRASMLRWVRATVDRIISLQPRRVLEVGF